MPMYDVTLTLAGVIDVQDAALLQPLIDDASPRYYVDGAPTLAEGEREFNLHTRRSNEMPRRLRQALHALKLSYAYFWAEVAAHSESGGDTLQGGLDIYDAVLDRCQRFIIRDNTYILSGKDLADPVVVEMSKRWDQVDDYPDLYLIESHHEALRLAQNPDTAEAAQHYLDRLAQRAKGA